MNSIMNHGFVSPYILFNFAGGSIDTAPPRYFASFHQDRSINEAASFELTLIYVAGMLGDSTASNIHQMLLNAVDKPVYYIYGYRTPGGGVKTQDQAYTGIFTQYFETINDGYLTYKICGVAHSVPISTPSVKVSDYMKRLKSSKEYEQPSNILQGFISDNSTGFKELLENFDIDIDHSDRLVETSIISIEDGTLSEVLSGKKNADGTGLPGGLVSYSVAPIEYNSSIISLASAYDTLSSHGASSSITSSMSEAKNKMVNQQEQPFVCYFDNVVGQIGSSKKGSLHYVPKQRRQVTNSFVYNFGNNFIDSDVLSFDVNVDDIVAMATRNSSNSASCSIDVNGNLIGSNYNEAKVSDFTKNTYNTLSGFDESAWVTLSMLSDSLNFSYSATMTVVGQTECNKLLDKITVNVFINGVPHVGLTGNYVILGITEDLSDSGFTTTFELQRAVETEPLENDFVSTPLEGTAAKDAKNLKDDYNK